MSESCNHDCSSCGRECGKRKTAPDFSAPLNAASRVGRVVAVASGKGGVGKSLVATMLAVAASKAGKRVGTLDADITGPSIPRSFGISCGTYRSDDGIEPAVSTAGIRVMSLNMLVENPSDPVVWRGPVIAGVVIVSSPQDLVEMIVSKSARMAGMMHKPVLGLVENMSYLKCPDCGRRISVFGDSHAEELAKRFSIPRTVRLPLDPAFAAAVDAGAAETLDLPEFEEFANSIC